MESSYLIQRLQKPFPPAKGKDSSLLESLSNAFSFGGGLINGGISKEGMALLKDIFRFDYMGSSEFEWGAVPKAMQEIAKNIESYVSDEMEVTSLRKPWKLVKGKEQPIIKNTAKVYVICRKENIDEIKSRIVGWATEEPYGGKTKERINLINSICPESDWDRDVCGWLELDNGFFFFTNKEMFEKTEKLFGVNRI